MPVTVWQIKNMNHEMNGNGDLIEKKSWNHIKLIYFWHILAVWNHCGAVAQEKNPIEKLDNLPMFWTTAATSRLFYLKQGEIKTNFWFFFVRNKLLLY